MGILNVDTLFVDRYKVISEISETRFLESCIAVDKETNQTVRIDIFPKVDVPGPKSLIQLEQELQVRSTITNQFILRLYAFGRVDLGHGADTIYMISEHSTSPTLFSRIYEGVGEPLKFVDILHILRNIGESLKVLHQAGLSVCKLLPKQILVAEEWEVKLPAFSYLTSAQWLRDGSALSRSTGIDYRYLAPEMLSDGGLTPGDEKSDVYQFGILAFELGCGTLPFEGITSTIRQMQQTEPLPDLLRSNQLPDWYDKFVLGCMQKTPVNRPFIESIVQSLGQYISSASDAELQIVIDYPKLNDLQILFVEDNKLDQLFLSRLTKSERYPFRFTFANSVERANRLISNKKFDLIITDYMLPDGIAVDLIKAHDSIPFIVVSGSASPEVRSAVLSAGAFQCIAKEPLQKHLSLIPRLIIQTIEFNRLKKETAELKNKIDSALEAIRRGYSAVDKQENPLVSKDSLKELIKEVERSLT